MSSTDLPPSSVCSYSALAPLLAPGLQEQETFFCFFPVSSQLTEGADGGP